MQNTNSASPSLHVQTGGGLLGKTLIDPLDYSPGGGSLSEYARAFGPGSSAQSPANAGFSAGLERLEFLLRRGNPPPSDDSSSQFLLPTTTSSVTAAAAVDASAVVVMAVPSATTVVVASTTTNGGGGGGGGGGDDDTTVVTALGARLRNALTLELDPAEADALAVALDAVPRSVLTSGVRPAALTNLVTNAPAVAAAFIAATARTGPPAMLEAYLDALLPVSGFVDEMVAPAVMAGGGGGGSISKETSLPSTNGTTSLTPPLSLRNLEVMHTLLLRQQREGVASGLPEDLRDRHLSAALACVSASGGGARSVRLICAYVRALVRDGLLSVQRKGEGKVEPPPLVVEEVKAFAIAHAKLPEAAELFRLILEEVEGRRLFFRERS